MQYHHDPMDASINPPMGLLAKIVEVHSDRLLSDARMLPVLKRSPSGCRSTGAGFERRNPGNVHRAFRDGQVMASLEVDPERRSVAEQLTEANRRLGSNRLFLIEDVVERPAGCPERSRHPVLLMESAGRTSSSTGKHRQLAFVHRGRRECERLADIPDLKIGILRHDASLGQPLRDETDNGGHGDAEAPETEYPASDPHRHAPAYGGPLSGPRPACRLGR